MLITKYLPHNHQSFRLIWWKFLDIQNIFQLLLCVPKSEEFNGKIQEIRMHTINSTRKSLKQTNFFFFLSNTYKKITLTAPNWNETWLLHAHNGIDSIRKSKKSEMHSAIVRYKYVFCSSYLHSGFFLFSPTFLFQDILFFF